MVGMHIRLLLLSASAFASPGFISSLSRLMQLPARAHVKMSLRTFVGEAYSEIAIPKGMVDLDYWLSSENGCAALLGAENAQKREDGLWACQHASVPLFGMNFLPVFISSIEHSSTSEEVLVRTIETKFEVLDDGGESTMARRISGLMDRIWFTSLNTVTWQQSMDEGWTLSANFSMNMSMALPRFMFLPPGFNSAASSIVSKTCRDRLSQTLITLRNEYLSCKYNNSDWNFFLYKKAGAKPRLSTEETAEHHTHTQSKHNDTLCPIILMYILETLEMCVMLNVNVILVRESLCVYITPSINPSIKPRASKVKPISNLQEQDALPWTWKNVTQQLQY